MNLITYYEMLGVAENASSEQIKKGYRSQSSMFHPDKNSGRTEWANGWMQRINEAYNVLSNPASRARYDAKLRAERGQDDAQKQASANNREAAAKEAAERAHQQAKANTSQSFDIDLFDDFIPWAGVIFLLLVFGVMSKM